MTTTDTVALVKAAGAGDQAAWDTLVDRFSGLVWSVARATGLSPADCADVSQTVWLRCVQYLDRVREPERLGAWLATTTRNESFRLLRSGRRTVLGADTIDLRDDSLPAMGAEVETRERDRLLASALDRLDERCRTLLRMLCADPPVRYDDAAVALGLARGSVGVIRTRCLERLRRQPEILMIEETER